MMSELSDERINEIIDGTLNITFAESELMAIELKERRASALFGEAATTELWEAFKDILHNDDICDYCQESKLTSPKWARLREAIDRAVSA